MNLKLGTVIAITKELAEKLTGDPYNNRFLISVVTDNSVVMRSAKDNKSYNVRNEKLLENFKWTESRFDVRYNGAANDVRLKQEEEGDSDNSEDKDDGDGESEEDSGESEEDSGNNEEDSGESEEDAITVEASGKIRIVRISAGSSFEEKEDDPYSDGDDVYG
jgi:hypothetical protein